MAKHRHYLAHEVRAILSERGYEKVCRPLEELAQRIQETESNVSTKVWVYKFPGLILLGLIPIISTSLSMLVTADPRLGAWRELSYVLTWLLTFLTVLNSIFRPSERFKESCRIGVDFQRIKSDFLADLESLPQIDESHLHGIVSKFNKLVEPYQKELIALFLPESAVEETKSTRVSGRPSHVNETPEKTKHST